MGRVFFEREIAMDPIENGIAQFTLADGDHACTVHTLRTFTERARRMLAEFDHAVRAPIPIKGGRSRGH